MSHTPVNASPTQSPAVLTLPDPEVVVKAQRRRFTAEYQRRILQEADACTHLGEGDAAYLVALDKVVRAMRLRGWV